VGHSVKMCVRSCMRRTPACWVSRIRCEQLGYFAVHPHTQGGAAASIHIKRRRHRSHSAATHMHGGSIKGHF
jgi:hypothetical protein